MGCSVVLVEYFEQLAREIGLKAQQDFFFHRRIERGVVFQHDDFLRFIVVAIW